MSRDTVDDLHEAEDTIGFLTARLEEVEEAAMAARLSGEGWWTALGRCERIAREGVNHGKSYCRCAWCEDEDEPGGGYYECDPEYCGCPADHEHPHPFDSREDADEEVDGHHDLEG